MRSDKMKDTYNAGLFAEWVARMFLRFHGFQILERRYVTGRRTGRAEIDIIAKRKNLIIFVEVKNRPTVEIGINSIGSAQHKRLRASASMYLARIGWLGDSRFDAIIVTPWQITHLPNAI